jgi:hypothetical protein
LINKSGASAIEMATNTMDKIFLRIREIRLKHPDGSIIAIGKAEQVTEGWVVKVKDGQNLEGEDGMIEAFGIASQTTRTVAGWKDGETELWDVVEIFKNEDEATERGIENGQLAIYQIETARLKWLK